MSDPAPDPYASMTKLDLVSLMEQTPDPTEWSRLNEILLSKMTARELETRNRALEIGRFLAGIYQARGVEQCAFLCLAAGAVAAHVAEGMPPIGPPELVN